MSGLKSFRTLVGLCRNSPRTAERLMSSSSDESTTRNSAQKLLDGTSSLDTEDPNQRFVSSAYHVDRDTLERLEKDVKRREKTKPRDTTVLLFPGQGSQYPGMAEKLKKVPGVKAMYDYASSAMKFDMLKLCCEGPERLLGMTVNCQLAVLVTSLAALEKLRYQDPRAVENCVTTAGFSVGEYAALVFAGVMTFEEAVQVVKFRGEAMQSCAQERQSGLLITFTGRQTNINYAMKLAREWCQEKEGIEDPVCEVANYLSPDVKVVGGDRKALDFLKKNAREFGIKRTKTLPVSGAFHTRLMKPAKNVVKKALSQVELKPTAIPVISNLTGYPYQQVEAIRGALNEHVYEPVKWEQSMHYVYTREEDVDFPETYEVGPGETLRPLLKSLNMRAYKKSHKVATS